MSYTLHTINNKLQTSYWTQHTIGLHTWYSNIELLTHIEAYHNYNLCYEFWFIDTIAHCHDIEIDIILSIVAKIVGIVHLSD